MVNLENVPQDLSIRPLWEFPITVNRVCRVQIDRKMYFHPFNRGVSTPGLAPDE
jgi:hypothetical protein